MTETKKTRPKFAAGDACFRCKQAIVKIQPWAEDNEHGGAPVTALVESHWVTPYGALCPKCYPSFVMKWQEELMAKDRRS